MKFKLIIFAYLTTLISNGQDVEEIIRFHSNSKQAKQKYYVLKSDKSIKHGVYREYHRIREDDYKKMTELEKDSLLLKTMGLYDNDTKRGEWKYYYKPIKNNNRYIRGYLKETGEYINDKRIGIWKIYQDYVIERYDYDSERYFEPIFNFFFNYPPIALEEGIEGNVVIRYLVNNDCSFSAYEIVSGIEGLNKEAIRYVNFKSKLYQEYMIKLDSCISEYKTDTIKFILGPK